MKKRITGILLALGIVLGCCAGSAEEIPELMEPAGIELDYAPAQRMDMYTVTPYAGSVIPYTEDLSFSVDGIVERVHVSLGSSVKAGDVLITLDEGDLIEREEDLLEQISYQKKRNANADEIALIDIRIAQIRLEGMKAGGADEAACLQAQSDIEMMELILRQNREEQNSALAKLESELTKVQENIGKNTLVAPYDGVIVSISDLRAEYGVSAYEPVIRIADESRPMISCAYVGQNLVKSAHEIYALVRDLKFAVEYIPVDMDEYLSVVFSGAQLKTKFNFADGHEGAQCGDYATICTVTGYTEHVLAIPCNALYSDSAGRYVYRLDEDGQRERVNVHTGVSNTLYIEITEGLEEGDLVYVKE